MKKLNAKNELRDYPPIPWSKGAKEEWLVESPPSTEPNVVCACGSKDFKICWWDYPYTGGYCKIYCNKCGESILLIDDYA